ncbi:phospholipid/cholesterol/gamma-HCH transport system substrate-binding protein [Nocardioides daedukensis]|uniref:Phospholipid/cholesterol/gamma-HCH transport system substrate-binding protein n=1 Tax=Nocardioides daedukensis TaxID=634462 RepID=A0A7Y9UNW3_9ACTN|nr:MCE family protein [Nocardioides daedukensis]NYG57582.1 phospholipid/cholesterol/gamma-HCH transport system substrate-binding protein [Nocardioides daedukensis]
MTARIPTRPMKRIATVLIASLALLLAACDFDGAYDLPLPGSPVDKDKSYVITADFRDVLNVVPKSPVMVDDVTVGEITEVDRNGWHARVTMRIRDDVKLPANSMAMIRQTSLLGEKYVALEEPVDEPAAGVLTDKGHIALSATGRNPEVEEVLGALSFLLSGGGVAQLGTITTELNNVMSGRTGDVKRLLTNLDQVVGTLDDQKADIIDAMESMNKLATTLNTERDAIGEAIDVMPAAIKVLKDQHGELVKMLKGLEELGKVGTRVIGASKDDLIASLKSLKPILTALNEAGASLPAGLSLMLSFPFPEEAQDIVKGDYGNTEIRLDVNLENYITDSLITLPDPAELVKDLTKCLGSGNLASKACAKFLTNLDLFRELRAACKEPINKLRDVCKILAKLPGGGLPDLSDLSKLLGQPGLSAVPELLGLDGLLGLKKAATGGPDAPRADLYGTGITS